MRLIVNEPPGLVWCAAVHPTTSDTDTAAEAPARRAPGSHAAARPVFLDASGRRQRWVRRIGRLLVIPAAGYVALLLSAALGGPTISSPYLPLPEANDRQAADASPGPAARHSSGTGSGTGTSGASGTGSAGVPGPGLSPSPSPTGATATASPTATGTATHGKSTATHPSRTSTHTSRGHG